jgi:hypothetical protein
MNFRDQGSGIGEQRNAAVILSEADRASHPRTPRFCRCFSFRQPRTRVPHVSLLRPGNGRIFAALLGLSALMFVAGCRQDMQNQPRMFPQRGSNFFPDHRGARPQVVNTVARGQLHEDSYFYTGVTQGANGYREEHDELPFPVTMEVLKRGQERFNIYCSPCHSRVGNGLGEIVQRGYKPAANLHDQVRLAQPLSHYFYVMSHGYGAMPDYSAQITPVDRWAVAAYIRALQLSQNAKESDVPTGVEVKNLKDVAQGQGLPASFAEPWPMPETAVQPYAHTREGTPAMAPGNPADPKQLAPNATKQAPTGK